MMKLIHEHDLSSPYQTSAQSQLLILYDQFGSLLLHLPEKLSIKNKTLSVSQVYYQGQSQNNYSSYQSNFWLCQTVKEIYICFPVKHNRQSLQSTLATMHCGVIWLISTVTLAFGGFGAYKYNSYSHQELSFATVTNLKYNFNVYCPINQEVAEKYYSDYFESTHLDPNLYVVFVRGDNFTNTIYNQSVANFAPTKLRLMYCGWAREWQGSCEDARHVCSYPGPMFHLPVGQESTIVYVNQIPSDLQSDPVGCYFKPTPEDCKVDAKIIEKNHQETQGCTFYQTTNFSYPTRQVIVNSQHANISPHIHGLEVRPAFDGNPYGWFNIKGDKGPGYFSLNDAAYFSQFQKKELTSMSFFTDRHNMKVIRAPNKQGPGTLFYHDHAMRSTLYNVLHGMSGMYVLYDKHIERDLPKGSEQKYLVLAPPNDDDIRTEYAKSQQPNITYKDEAEALKDTFSRNMTYRFRILDGHFENFFYNLSFGIYSEKVELPDGTTFLNELDPYTQQFPVTENFTRINFTVIGTDSVLFDEPVYNVDIFDLSNSERIDLLIRFSEEDGVPTHFNHVFLMVYQKSLHKYVIKHDFLLNRVPTNNKYAAPINTKALEMPFTNLSTVPKSQIVMNRMRIILSRPPGLGYWMQGHMMSEGQADAPKIGTIQDWYFICADSEAHPIHLHLVNFQVIQKYTMKLAGENCTYYELDFYKNSKYPAFDNLTYSQLCDYLNFFTAQQNNKLIEFMGNYSLENDFVQTDMGKVSGLNVLQKIVTEEDMRIYGQNNQCSQNKIYKYICEDTTNTIRSYYKRWRDNLHADPFTVIVSRVRWTETSYDQNVRQYPYFSFASEDALIEFPGYVYHCHLLDHEDKEMMRPYVLTPSDKYMEKLKKENKSGPHLTRSRKFHNVQKPQSGDIWFKKANQINQRLNCPS